MEPSDASLAERALAGDDDAFGQLVTRHQREVYAYVFRVARDAHAACDITQSVFIRAYRSLSQLRDSGKLRSWLLAIAVNQSRNWLTRRRPPSLSGAGSEDRSVGLRDEGELADPHSRASPAAVYEAKELAAMIAEAIDSLPATYREVAVLRFQHQLKVGEIAASLGLGFTAAESRVRRAKAMLRTKLGGVLVEG